MGLSYTDPDQHHKGWWSPEEDAVIRKHYARGGTTVCAPLLQGRSKNAIRTRASDLGVSCGYKHRGGCWTRAENKIMREHYPTGGFMKVQELLPHRSRDAIFNRAHHLKLHRIPAWNAEEERILKDTYTRGGLRLAKAALPHHSRQSIRAKKQKLNLHVSEGWRAVSAGI
jgi:hypothetical protein